MAPEIAIPESFARAVAKMNEVRTRSEIVLEDAPPPLKLAPYAHAIGGTVSRGGDEVATGRLILLHDPAGHESWDGTLRLVTYVTAELESEIASDPLLSQVGWSWLVDALDHNDAGHRAIGGTVTLTVSTRFGDLAGPPTVADLEIRASWTPEDDTALDAHMRAWCALLASTAGLPPEGVTALESRAQHSGSGTAS
jgi:Protein of unknown function (DUF3000)